MALNEAESARPVEAAVLTRRIHPHETIDHLVRACPALLVHLDLMEGANYVMNKVGYVLLDGKLNEKATACVFRCLSRLAELNEPLVQNVLEVLVSRSEGVRMARNRLVGKALTMLEVIEDEWPLRRR